MSHVKGQNRAPEKEFTKMEVGNISEAEFKTLVIRMLKELERGVGELSENFDKEIKKHKNGDEKHNRVPVTYEEHNI